MGAANNANGALPKPVMLYGGTAKECCNGPPMGLVDIGECEKAYLFRVSLPGLKKDESEVRCAIEKEGTVHITGKVPEDGVKGSTGAYVTKVQQLCSPGPFKISFQLPGPVDPRLCDLMFQGDGILEVVVMKSRSPVVHGDNENPIMVQCITESCIG